MTKCLFAAGPYTATDQYPVLRDGIVIARFVTEEEAKSYADYRNAMLEQYNTTDVTAYDNAASGEHYHVGDGRRSGPITSSCDNVIAWRLGEAARAAKPGGDLIDYGLSLLRELKEKGFVVLVT